MQSSREFNALQEEIRQCSRCGLAAGRQHVIVGEGNPFASIMLIGEAPGREEDQIGRPFVGKSGQLLDNILEACGFSRKEHVFISNIVKCRPPDNRVPTPREAAVCMPWLKQQIECINPKILILVGATALKYMAGPSYKITQVHGQWLNIGGRLLMPVYHPAALLRNPELKKPSWEDFKKVVLKYRELVDPAHYCAYL